MNIYTKITSVFLLISLFFIAESVFAAEIRLDTHKSEVNSDEQFSLDIIVHSEESLNAISGRLVFPTDKLSIKEIRDGNSVINFWIEKPHIEKSGSVLFSGITPGGFNGANKSIFSVVFEAKGTGLTSIVLEDLKALKNDGLGSPVELKLNNTAVYIKSGISNASEEILTDKDLPENFFPTIEKDPNIFDGKYFLVFATQDKISGIANYKVREGILDWFTVVESPYLLKDQTLSKKIFLKAIDKLGNERIIEIEPKYPPSHYENIQYWFIIISVLFILLFLIKKLCRKKNSQN